MRDFQMKTRMRQKLSLTIRWIIQIQITYYKFCAFVRRYRVYQSPTEIKLDNFLDTIVQRAGSNLPILRTRSIF